MSQAKRISLAILLGFLAALAPLSTDMMAIIILLGESLTLIIFLKMVYFVHRHGHAISAGK